MNNIHKKKNSRGLPYSLLPRRLILCFVLFTLLFSFSVTAFRYWNYGGNAGFESSLYGMTYKTLFSSPVPDHHNKDPKICSILINNAINPLIDDINLDSYNEVLLFDTTHIYIYNWNCSLMASITTPENIYEALIIWNHASNEYDFAVLGATKLYLYNFQSATPYMINTANISLLNNIGDISAISCLRGYKEQCNVFNSNDMVIYYLSNLTARAITNNMSASLSQIENFMGSPNYEYFSSTSSQAVAIPVESGTSLDIDEIWENGSRRDSHTVMTSAGNGRGYSSFLASGTQSQANLLFYSGHFVQYNFAIKDTSGNNLLSGDIVHSNTVGVSNWVVTDFDNDGLRDFDILIYNNTQNIWQFLQLSTSGATLLRKNIGNFSINNSGFKGLVIAEFLGNNTYKELLTEEGIYQYDGSTFSLALNITSYRGEPNGKLAVGQVDRLNAVNKAIYVDDSNAVFFGYGGSTDPIVYTFCGDLTCNVGETADTCPIDCDPDFLEGSQCNVHATPPCIFEHYFDYTSPIKIQYKGFDLFFNPNLNLIPINQKLDTDTYNIQEEVISRYIPYTPSPYYTMEFSLNMRDKLSSMELLIGEQGSSLDVYDRIDLFFSNRSIDYYYTDSFGSRSLKRGCVNCYSTGIEHKYKIYFFFLDTPFKLFDNSSNLSTVAKRNTYTLLQDSKVLFTDVPFLSVSSLDDGNNFDHISFGLRHSVGNGTVNLTIDDIYLYEGSNNATSNVNDLVKDSIKLLNQTTKCIGGFCVKGNDKYSNKKWDCSVKPQCCGLRYDGTYGAKDGWCVIWETSYDLVIRPLIKWAFATIIIAIILLFIGGTLYVLWLRANR